MNERLWELAEKSVVNMDIETRADRHRADRIDIRKFAELIVRESIVCAEREWIRNGDTEHNRAVTKVIESIKEHFGVL